MLRKFFCAVITAVVLSSISAQQNLFNVPNGEITKTGSFFFQEQTNISANTIQSNTTVDYGLANNFEVGLNLFFLNLATDLPLRTQNNSTNTTAPAAPLLMANAQKGFSANNWLHFSLGGQTGVNLGDAANTQLAWLTYGTAIFREKNTGGSLHLGMYRGNIAYNGSGNGFLMGGIEFPILKGTFHFVFDIIQGSHANAVFVPGILYYFSERTGFSVGWQKPFPASVTEQALVFELSLL